MTYAPTELHKKILSHLVLLFTRDPLENASGVLVSISDRIFVLTASHVLGSDLSINLGIQGQVTQFTILNRWEDDRLDIAFLELKPFEVALLRIDEVSPFIVEKKQEIGIPPRVRTVALCGFPSVSHARRGSTIQFTPWILNCALMAPKEWPTAVLKSRDPNHHFVVLYGPKHKGQFYDPEGRPIGQVEPQGLSGCGLWLFDQRTESSSHPVYSLIGIQHSYFRTDQVLTGTFAEHAIDALLDKTGIVL